MKKFNDVAGFQSLATATSAWIGTGVTTSGTPIALHGWYLQGNDIGAGLWFYNGNEALEDPILKDVATGGANTNGSVTMLDTPIVFNSGCYVQVDASTVGSVFYHNL